jgi:malic enzyme
MLHAGYSEDEAKQAFWLVDSKGLVHKERYRLEVSKRKYAQPIERIAEWKVVRSVQPQFV